MTMYELALRYGESAQMLRQRIRELNAAARQAEDEETLRRLKDRLRPLNAMYRETRLVERHLLAYFARRPQESKGEAL